MLKLNLIFIGLLTLILAQVSFANESSEGTATQTKAVDTQKLDEKCGEHGAEKASCGDKASHSTGHDTGKHNHAEVMNSLFPEKTPNKALGQIPGVVEIKSPAFLSKVESSVKLEWGASQNATVYHLQVATDPNFKWLLTNEKALNGTSFEFTAPERGKKYFWRVAGVNRDNKASHSKSSFVSSAFEVK